MAASPVFSVPFFREQGFTGTHDIMVPPGSRWVLRCVDAYANVGLTGRMTLFIMELPTLSAIWWYELIESEHGHAQWTGRQVIEHQGGAGGLRVFNQGTEPVDVSLSGYQLLDPA